MSNKGLDFAVAPETFPRKAVGGRNGLSFLHHGPLARWQQRATTAEANRHTCITLAEQALAFLPFSGTGFGFSKLFNRVFPEPTPAGAEHSGGWWRSPLQREQSELLTENMM